MSLATRVCGATLGLRSSLGCNRFLAAAAGLDGLRAPGRHFRSSFQRHHRRHIRQETLRIPTCSSDSRDGSSVPCAAGSAHSKAPAAWPADITERARRILSDDDSPSTPFNGNAFKDSIGACSFVPRAEMQRQLQAEDAQAFWTRVRRAISRPLSGEAAAADDSFGDLEGSTKGTFASPIVYKRYVDGMTAAHHYPSRLLPPNESRQVPPLLYVTPFDLQESPDSPGQSLGLGFKGTELFTSRAGMQPKSPVSE